VFPEGPYAIPLFRPLKSGSLTTLTGWPDRWVNNDLRGSVLESSLNRFGQQFTFKIK
jgi:hypothetical protein